MANNRDNKNTNTRQGTSRILAFVFYVIMLIGLAIYYFAPGQKPVETITWKEFKEEMLHDVNKVIVTNKETVDVYIKKESLKKPKYKSVNDKSRRNEKGPHYRFNIGSVDVFEQQMEEAQRDFTAKEKIPIEYVSQNPGWFSNVLSWLIPLALLAFFWFYVMRRVSPTAGERSVFDFGKSTPDVYEKGKTSTILFKDVAGYEEAKTEILEVVKFLKRPETFTRLGAKIPKGILLIGPPGSGKTLMAKAVAGEAGVPFFSLSGSEFIEMFVGVGASRVRDLFNKAKLHAPSIVFIDEIDAIGRIRGKAVSIQANDERESTLNQLLAEMDGFGAETGVIVLAATNRADILDPALVRAGRFDRHIHLELPNKAERSAIFNVHLKPLKLDTSVNAEFLASQTPGFSGADIANVCNEAALIAARNEKNMVDIRDFNNAVDRVISGLEKKTKIITPEERKIIAYHESGHAIVSWMLNHVDPIQKVSIIPRGKSLGGAWYLPKERQIITRTEFFERLCAAMGGRAAEEIVFNEISSGAMDDLEKATKQAYLMVAHLGLSKKIGNISFHDSTGVYDNAFQKPYSETTGKLIDEEVQKFLEEAYLSAKNILLQNREKLNILADCLMEKEVVYQDGLEVILGKRSEAHIADVKKSV